MDNNHAAESTYLSPYIFSLRGTASVKFERATLETCPAATGIVVVIDVIRAFSTAAYAFASGATKIVLVSSVGEAFEMKKRLPTALVMGEVGGLPVDGFDFGNSPTEILQQPLTGRQLIQRTSAGTQGIVRSVNAGALLASSFCCAKATARYIQSLSGGQVTFVMTGVQPDGLGDEDRACADYLEALLRGNDPDPEPYLRRVRNSDNAQKFYDPHQPAFPLSDLKYCLAANQFDFAMVVTHSDGLLLLQSVVP
jgi:2-phosphosulfolactate phosphatase